jgi:hypothetical protein
VLLIQGLSGDRSMRIEGSVRANLIAAVASARRFRGRPVHKDTADHWRRLLDYGRLIDRQASGESVGDVLAQLETEMTYITVG